MHCLVGVATFNIILLRNNAITAPKIEPEGVCPYVHKKQVDVLIIWAWLFERKLGVVALFNDEFWAYCD